MLAAQARASFELGDRVGRILRWQVRQAGLRRLRAAPPERPEAAPQASVCPTEQSIVAGEWFRLLAELMDAVAVPHRVAVMIADADQHKDLCGGTDKMSTSFDQGAHPMRRAMSVVMERRQKSDVVDAHPVRAPQPSPGNTD